VIDRRQWLQVFEVDHHLIAYQGLLGSGTI